MMRCQFESDCYRAKYCGMPADCEQRNTVLAANAIDASHKDAEALMRAQGKKRCKRCNQALPLTRFYPHRNNLDGREGTCIACRKRMARKRARERKRNEKVD